MDLPQKPMLIVPPAPTRWPALADLYQHQRPPWAADLERRITRGVPGAHDVYAVLSLAGRFVAGACINKFGEFGVLGHCYTRPECRRQGAARKLIDGLLSWFDMTGGKWLYLAATADLADGLFGKFGFSTLHHVPWASAARVTMLRMRGGSENPLAEDAGEATIRPLSRAEWPTMVALLQYCPGPDPRVSVAESAVIAELFALDLIDHQEHSEWQLLGAFRGPRLVGLATVAMDREGARTHAMLIPQTGAPVELRNAIVELAHGRGYEQVDFPMEAIVQRELDTPPPESPPEG